MKSMPSLTPHSQTIAKKSFIVGKESSLPQELAVSTIETILLKVVLYALKMELPFFLLSHTHFVFF
jgi:hypothetical protein